MEPSGFPCPEFLGEGAEGELPGPDPTWPAVPPFVAATNEVSEVKVAPEGAGRMSFQPGSTQFSVLRAMPSCCGRPRFRTRTAFHRCGEPSSFAAIVQRLSPACTTYSRSEGPTCGFDPGCDCGFDGATVPAPSDVLARGRAFSVCTCTGEEWRRGNGGVRGPLIS